MPAPASVWLLRNPDNSIVTTATNATTQVLINAGCGMDCSSTSELHIAQQLGVKPENIMFTSNYTPPSDLAWAFDQGFVMNLDDISLVQTLVDMKGRCPDLISFRLNPVRRITHVSRMVPRLSC
jgi:diaminopimelate decarboxylase